MNMTIGQYRQLRSAYRYLRREDRKWRPDPYAARNVRQVPPNTAGKFLELLDEPLRTAVQARPLPGPAPVERGPRARWYANWYPALGRYANLNLGKRVAFRRALRQMRELDRARSINPVAGVHYAAADMWAGLSDKLEATNLRYRAERERVECNKQPWRNQGVDA